LDKFGEEQHLKCSRKLGTDVASESPEFSCQQPFSIQFGVHLTLRSGSERNQSGLAPVLKNPGEGWKVIIRPGEMTDQLGEWTDGPRGPHAADTELTLNLIGGKEDEKHTKNCGFGRGIGFPGSRGVASHMCDL
jgi:hypothetical protein